MRKQPQYGLLLGLTILLTLSAVWTLMPWPATKPNDLGYYSHCSWTPWSTLILLALAGVVCTIRARWFKTTAHVSKVQ